MTGMAMWGIDVSGELPAHDYGATLPAPLGCPGHPRPRARRPPGYRGETARSRAPVAGAARAAGSSVDSR